jgi:hypothetical protein
VIPEMWTLIFITTVLAVCMVRDIARNYRDD